MQIITVTQGLRMCSMTHQIMNDKDSFLTLNSIISGTEPYRAIKMKMSKGKDLISKRALRFL